MSNRRDQAAILSYGVRVGFQSDRPELVPLLETVLAPGWHRADSREAEFSYSLLAGAGHEGPSRYRLYIGQRTFLGSGNMGDVVETLESHVQANIAENAPDSLFVHAGVVGWGDTAIVIPGRSFSGKSVLVRELLSAGATYYSDEFAVLDPDGLVHPYARPLSIRTHSRHRLRLVPETLGSTRGIKPLKLGLILDCKYSPGACAEPVALTPGQALLCLLQNTVAVRARPEAALRVLGKAVSGVAAFRTKRGEARDFVDILSLSRAGGKNAPFGQKDRALE